MITLPNNMTSIEDTRMIGLAGLAFLGETAEPPQASFHDDNGNNLLVYSDGSVWQSANISEVWPSVGDYLMDCDGSDHPLSAQLRDWSESD